MTILELIVLSIGLGMDACSVAIIKGICMKNNIHKTLIVSLYFATFQLVMPIIGYYFGSLFTNIKFYSHIISFILLVLLGLNMLKESCNKSEESLTDDISFKAMIIPSIATSIDALSVGVTFSLLDINIISSSIVIFIITFILSTIGVKVGEYFGNKYTKKAQIIGGLILIIIGIKMII